MPHSPECHDLLRHLYERCIPSVVRRAQRLLGTEAEAWDVVHDTFLNLLKHCTHVIAHARPMALVYRASVNGCYNRLKSLTRLSPQDPHGSAEPGFTPEVVEARNALREISRLVDEQTFQLGFFCWMDGMTQEEAAELLGLSRKTVGKKLKLLQRLATTVIAGGEAT
jgi:RNA polymerase sigma-70 factor (ECF subfamily)